MKAGVLVAVLLAAVLVIAMLRGSRHASRPDDSFSGAVSEVERDDDQARRPAAAGSQREYGRSMPGPGQRAVDERRNDVDAVRDRLAAAGARAAAHGGQHAIVGESVDAGGDGATADSTEQPEALRPKAVAGGAVHAEGNTAADAESAGGEPAPAVAYDSSLDKSFALETQTQVADVGKISGAAGAVSFWIKPKWDEGNQDDATFVQLGDSGLHFVKNVNFLRFEFFDRNGAEQGLGTNIGDWKSGEWHQVVGTWVGTSYQLYVDGKPISTSTFASPPDFQEQTNVYVGSKFLYNAPAAPGEMTGVRVSNLPMSAGEIAGQYQSGQRPR